jgi:hypothetical protein
MQLFWLSSLPFREQLPEGNMSRLKQHLENIFLTGNLYEDRHIDGGLSMVEKCISLPFRLPFIDGIDAIIDFYSRRRPQLDCPEKIVDNLIRAREVAIEDVPYEPDVPISISNRTITRFASQLDYVALKLVTSSPEELYMESKNSFP